jgi:hypothetical protein
VWILIKTCVQNFAAEGTGIDAFIIYDSSLLSSSFNANYVDEAESIVSLQA